MIGFHEKAVRCNRKREVNGVICFCFHEWHESTGGVLWIMAFEWKVEKGSRQYKQSIYKLETET